MNPTLPFDSPVSSRVTRATHRGQHAALRRLGLGLGHAWLFAVAAGAAHPDAGLLVRALGLPAVPVACALFALPSLWVLMTLFGVTLAPAALAEATSDATYDFGRLLLGLSPLTLLYVASTGALLAGLVVVAAAGTAFGLFVVRLCSAVLRASRGAPSEASLGRTLVTVGFVVFVVAVGARVGLPALVSLLGGPHGHGCC